MADQARYMALGTTAFDAICLQNIPAPDGGEAVRMRELAHLGKLSLRGSADTLGALCKLASLSVPAGNNQMHRCGDRHALWMGPDELMVLVEAGAEEALALSMTKAAELESTSIVNVTDAFCAISLSGSHVRDVLAKGCPLDLHPRIFAAGSCAQTLLAHSGVTIACLGEQEFILIGRNSFAAYIAAWLSDAALEYGLDCETS